MRFYILLFFLWTTFWVNAQHHKDHKDTLKTNQLEEVMITATRTQRAVATLPVPVQIIDGKTIHNTGISRLHEIIQEQTGLITVPDFGGGQGIQMQGLDAAYVIILVDGQPLVGRSAGTLDLSRIAVSNIERIEILKGASSSLYGSEALAGVVNIITKKPTMDNKVHLNVNYKYGSFQTHDANTTIQYGKKKIGFELFGNYYRTKGYNLIDNDFSQTVEPYYNFTVQPKLKIDFSKNINAIIGVRYFNQSQDYKSLISDAPYIGKSTIGEWNFSALINQTIKDRVKIVYDLYATNYNARQFLKDTHQLLFEDDRYNQWYFRPEIRGNYTIATHSITAGVGMNYETLERTSFEKMAKLNSEYFFAQDEWFITKKWNILFGFRYDHHNQYKSQFSPKIGLNYKINDALSLKTSVGYGYKAPDLRQLYFDFTNSSVGYTVLGYNVASDRLKQLQEQGQIAFTNNVDFSNPLKPESSINFNLGGFYKKDNLSFDFNFFYNRITNLIDTRAVAQKTNGQNVFSYFNLAKIFTCGVELNVSYKILKNLTVSAGYQYLTAQDESVLHQIAAGELFARDPNTLSSFKLNKSDYFGLFNRSKHTANFKINYVMTKCRTSVNIRLIYRSKYGNFDTNDNSVLDKYDQFIKGYFIANLTINKEFKYGISAQLGAINLFDYTDAQNIPSLPGRQLFARIQYNF